MDPYQYYDFALDFVSGNRAYNQFELPSIFPFFIVPFLKINPAISFVLSTNMVFLALILFAGYLLCVQFDIKKWTFVALVPFFCSPLIIGLSHSLYSELALSALVAWQYVVWFKSDHFKNRGITVLFVILFVTGLMTKSTYPVFFIGPWLLEISHFIMKKDLQGIIRLTGIFMVPVSVVILIQKYVFPASFEYYSTWFYTSLPIMPLIGPSKISLVDSIVYYFSHVWKTMLFLLTPFLIFPILPNAKNRKMLYLWIWFIAALVILTIPQVKEPRHAAPALLPALLLITYGISRIKQSLYRIICAAFFLFVSFFQYILVTCHFRTTPYLIDRPSYHNELVREMISIDTQKEFYIDSQGHFDFLHWKFTNNFIITGYDPPMALSLIWNLGPGVVYDIDLMEDPVTKLSRYGFENFEDLYFLEAFNQYNRQCLYNSNYETLDYQTVISNADFLIAGEETSIRELEGFYQRFHLVQQWKTGKGTVSLLQTNTPSQNSYRTLYGRRYLRNGKKNPETISAIYFDLIMNAALRHDSNSIIKLQKELQPSINTLVKPKNIYWIRNRGQLITLMNEFLSRHKISSNQ